VLFKEVFPGKLVEEYS